jgi:hypothetical protein
MIVFTKLILKTDSKRNCMSIAPLNIASYYIQGDSILSRFGNTVLQEEHIDLIKRTHVKITGPNEILGQPEFFDNLVISLINFQIQFIGRTTPTPEAFPNKITHEQIQPHKTYSYRDTQTNRILNVYCETSLDEGFKKAYEYKNPRDVPIHIA